MGLSGAQATAVKRTWDIVKTDLTGLGTEFLVMFLGKHGYQGLFKDFKDVPAGSLASNQRVKDTATKIMNEWCEIVDVCGNASALNSLLKKNAQAHQNRKIGIAHYNNMFVDLLEFLKAKLGAAYDGAAADGWKALTDNMSATLGPEF